MTEPIPSPESVGVRFLNWGGRFGGVLAWLIVGLLPLAFDFFGVLPGVGMTDASNGAPDAFPPAEAAGYTLYWLVMATFIYQVAVIPEALLKRQEGVVVIRGSAFTTAVPLGAVDAVRVGPGVPVLAAAGQDIPVYALIAPNLPEFGPFRRRRQKAFRAAVLAAKEVHVTKTQLEAPARAITGLSKPQVAMAIVNAIYTVFGLLSTTR
ncbi:hypothetical protein [Terrabacter sp. 2YAF2]|uniref:hypothetical protein n=1 Tax=Terrabacter sp. 2YAF2 TaxID=3233026 RepID=UPI003F991802